MKHLLEKIGAPFRGPCFQNRIARDVQVNRDRFAEPDVERTDYGEVRSVEGVRYSEDRGQEAYHALVFAGQRFEFIMLLVWNGATMVPGDVGDDMDVITGQPSQLAVDDQVIGMFMVLSFIDEIADVVEDRGILKPGTCGRAQFVEALRLIE